MFDIEGFVAECRAALSESSPALATKEVVERAIRDPEAIDAALGVPAHGGLRALHSSTDFTVLHIVWPPGVVLFPHDHGMWAANGIYGGAEDNTYYRRNGDHLDPAGGTRLSSGDVALLGAEAIHSVANPHRTYTAAIHVYGGDYFATPRSQWDQSGRNEAPFDVDEVRRILAEADD